MRHRNKVKALIIVLIIAILVIVGFSIYSLNFNIGKDSEKKKEQQLKNQIRENQIVQNQVLSSQVFVDDVGKHTNSIITNETSSSIVDGREETSNVRVVNSTLGFKMQYYPEYFNYEDESENNKDLFMSAYKVANSYVEVQHLNLQESNNLYETLKPNFENVKNDQKIGSKGYKGVIGYVTVPTNMTNPSITKYYFINDPNNSDYRYIIKTNYYEENKNTLGKKIEQMIDTFQIVVK